MIAEQPWFKTYWKQRGLLSLMLPCLALIIIFKYVPMAGLCIAFKDLNLSVGMLHSPWIGLENFQRLFGNVDFTRVLRNTVVISLLRLSFGFAAPLVLALLLNEIRLTGFKRSIQTLTYLPYFFSWVTLGGMMLMIFGTDGPLNMILQFAQEKVGAAQHPISFLGDPIWFVVILVVTGIWQSAGYGAVIYLAALAGINPDLNEAAQIDGASRWQQVRHITLPSLKPTMVILFILSLGSILDAGFDQIYNMYNPLVYSTSDIVDTYVLRHLVAMDYGMATAAGLFKSVVGLVLVTGANWLANRASDGEQGIW